MRKKWGEGLIVLWYLIIGALSFDPSMVHILGKGRYTSQTVLYIYIYVCIIYLYIYIFPSKVKREVKFK